MYVSYYRITALMQEFAIEIDCMDGKSMDETSKEASTCLEIIKNGLYNHKLTNICNSCKTSKSKALQKYHLWKDCISKNRNLCPTCIRKDMFIVKQMIISL